MRLKCAAVFVLMVSVLFPCNVAEEKKNVANQASLRVYTVINEETTAFKSFKHSVLVNKLPLSVLGLGEKWEGIYDKLLLLKRELEPYHHDDTQIVLFADGYDVLFNGEAEEILERFSSFNASIVFSAEKSCFPRFYCSGFPPVEKGQRYLNGGLFIGYAAHVYRMIDNGPVTKMENDLYLHKIYTNETLRKQLDMTLDYQSELFQNYQLNEDDFEIRFIGWKPYIYNEAFDTVPLIIHTQGGKRAMLKVFGNYIPDGWNPINGCLSCLQGTIDLKRKKIEDYPLVVIGIFIEQATGFVDEFLSKLNGLVYPKEKIHLFVHIAIEFYAYLFDRFVEEDGREYASITFIRPDIGIEEWRAKEMGIIECAKRKCDYYFYLDASAHIENTGILRILIEQNRTIVAPLLVQSDQRWANFWGSLTASMKFRRSMDYAEIIANRRRGLWNVPHIQNCYLVHGSVIHNVKTRPSYANLSPLADVAFCANMRAKDVDMFISNRVDFGHLIDPEDVDYQMELELHKPVAVNEQGRTVIWMISILITVVVVCLFVAPLTKRKLYSFTKNRRLLIVREKNFKFI